MAKLYDPITGVKVSYCKNDPPPVKLFRELIKKAKAQRKQGEIDQVGEVTDEPEKKTFKRRGFEGRKSQEASNEA